MEELISTIRRGSFKEYDEETDQNLPKLRKRSFSNRSEPRPVSSPIGFSQLLKRIEKHVKVNLDQRKDEPNSELLNEKHKLLEIKQVQAQKRREERLREFEKKSQVLKRRHQKMKEKYQQEMNRKKKKQIRKQKEGAQLRQKMLREKQKRAAKQRMKVSEISFLKLLEREAKQRDLDERLEETRRRKEGILEKIKREKEQKTKIKEEKTQKREKQREEQREKKKRRYENKAEGADRRRLERLEKRVRHSGRKRKMSERIEEVKYDFEDKVQAAKLEMKLAQADIERRMGGRRPQPGGSSPEDDTEFKKTSNSFDFADLIPKQEHTTQGHVKKTGKAKRRRKNHKKIPAWRSKYNHLLDKQIETNLRGNDLLQHYYKALTKDSEYSRTRRKTSFNSETSVESSRPIVMSSKQISNIEKENDVKLKSGKKNLVNHQLSGFKQASISNTSESPKDRRTGPKLNSSHAPFTQISELPELITRQVQADNGKKETDSRLCVLCDEVLGQTTNQEHLISKKHKKNKSQYIFTSLEETNCIGKRLVLDCKSQNALYISQKNDLMFRYSGFILNSLQVK